jgi:membrane-associated phospholipid phosphatase
MARRLSNVLRPYVAALCFALVLLGSTRARAADPDRVEWSPEWPRFRLVEALDTVALGAAAIALATTSKAPTHASWTGGVLFDSAIRDALRSQSASGQQRAADVSQWLYLGGVIVPNIIDLWVVALGVHQNPEVAAQMTLINMQSFGLAGVLSLGAEFNVGRARPYVGGCRADGTVRDPSGHILPGACAAAETYQSFYSGHAAATATMAGLTCAHHQHLPLYGGGVADLAPCLVTIGVSIGTGLTRIMADRHWSSDVIVGWSVGALSGYVLPSVLHYGFGGGRPIGEMKVGGARLVPTPLAFAGGAGLAVMGSY